MSFVIILEIQISEVGSRTARQRTCAAEVAGVGRSRSCRDLQRDAPTAKGTRFPCRSEGLCKRARVGNATVGSLKSESRKRDGSELGKRKICFRCLQCLSMYMLWGLEWSHSKCTQIAQNAAKKQNSHRGPTYSLDNLLWKLNSMLSCLCDGQTHVSPRGSPQCE